MRLEFAQPWWLLLLVPLVAQALWMARRLTTLGRARRAVAVAIRLVILALIVLALAGLRWSRTTRELIVQYVLDVSESIPPDQRDMARLFIQKTLGEMGLHDRAGLVLAGREAAVEQVPQSRWEWSEPKALLDRGRTNLARGIELAKALYLGETQRRLVLLTDGNQNAGDALEAARAAAAAGVTIDVYPLRYENRNDVIVEKALVDSRVNLDEPFDVRVIASARQAGKGRLSIHQDGRLLGEPIEVELEAGKKNVFVVPTQVREPGYHQIEVQFDAEGDRVPENNRAMAATWGEGEPRVLLVDGDAKPSPALAAMLQSEHIRLDVTAPEGIPFNLRQLQNYDSIIFNNVGADALTGDQMKMIERAVHDLGLGFVMIGGDRSFGAGGYNDSPIERILPVDMEIKNEKVLPQGALVPIVHTVEIPEGQYWAEQITLAALDVLSPRDLMGVLYYAWQGNEIWLFQLAEVGDKQRMRGLIKGMQPGDMPSFDRTLQMAHAALDKCGASVKHIVIISDGDPQTPNPKLARDIKAAHITISTVCINPHSPRDVDVMRELARLGGGNFYNVTNFKNLPQIFIKEAATVRKSLLIEEPFTPAEQQWSPLLTGIGKGYPQLRGYVATSPKPLADQPLVTQHKDPLLAHWRHGTGKTVAFTSDAKELWANAWLTWEQYAKFWAQLVRWSLRSPFNENYQVEMAIDGARGKVIIDAVDAQGQFRNLLRITGQVITPAMESVPVTFNQTGPGRYEAEFDASQPGSYILGATTTAGGEASAAATADGAAASQPDAASAAAPGELITGGATLSYSPEFQHSRSNEALLYQLADLTGGRLLDERTPVFLHDRRAYSQPRPAWPLLLAWALGLLLADVFVRRVLIDWSDVRAGAAAAWVWSRARLRRRRRAPVTIEQTEALLQAKQAVREQERHAGAPDPAAREAFLESLRRAAKEHGGAPAGAERETPPTPAAAATKPKPGAGADTGARRPGSGQAEPETFTGQLLQARKRSRKEPPMPPPQEPKP